MKLNVLKELPRSFQASVMLAGWPGMGSVGIGAIDYIRRKLDAVAFAEIDMQSHFTPEAMIVEDGIAAFPDPPAHIFYVVEEHDLIIFQSEAQIGGVPGDELLEKVLNVGQQVGIDTVLTGAAYLTQASHKEDAQVLGVANNTEFRDLLASHGIEILKEGMVSGLNGLLLGFAQKRELNAACFLGTMPQYAAPIPNPKASKEIVLALAHILNFSLDMSEIDDAAEKMEGTMEDIEMQIQKTFSHMDDIPDNEFPGGKIEEDKVPQSVMKRIEKMFREVKKTDQFQKKANELKAELDRWNLYPFYEDRFLNLFKSGPGESR
ncbi:MAG: PAC2 family protein [Candidatus Latescibacteria bacterium]|nr:PAC2 family protein [Candidatus Latescibacterota bacterium]